MTIPSGLSGCLVLQTLHCPESRVKRFARWLDNTRKGLWFDFAIDGFSSVHSCVKGLDWYCFSISFTQLFYSLF